MNCEHCGRDKTTKHALWDSRNISLKEDSLVQNLTNKLIKQTYKSNNINLKTFFQ